LNDGFLLLALTFQFNWGKYIAIPKLYAKRYPLYAITYTNN